MTDMPTRAPLTLAPRYLAILALPMLVVLASEILLSAFADTTVLEAVALAEITELTELVGRYRFLSIFFFYTAVCVTILGIFTSELLSRHSLASILRILAALLLLIVYASLFSSWDPDWMASFDAHELLGDDLFREGLRRADMPLCDAGLCGGLGGYFAMRLLLDITNIVSALAVSAVMLGMILALSRAAPIDLATQEGILAEAATLQQAQKNVRSYLYLSGVLLSVGMMFGLGWMLWPADLLADATQASGYRDLVQSISLYRGVSYTVLILSFYMPVSLIQMVRIERLHAAAARQGMEEAAVEVQGFDIERIGTLDAFKAILSILSPIIASALGSFTGINVLG